MAEFRTAIIGAGPAGMSAAARAAALDANAGVSRPSYLLLEAFERHAKTIQRYQKGKHVMAEPGFLDLRSDIRFGPGTREEILVNWLEDLERSKVNIRYGAEVKSVSGARGDFAISLADGSTVTSEIVILAIGLEGNPRKLGVDGQDLPRVQYQLDDPEEYSDETILVVGAGDAAIENAIGLARQNDVYILNRRDEFSRAKDGNLSAILAAINDPDSRLACRYSTSVSRVENGDTKPLKAVLETTAGTEFIHCDRIIARLGAIPPRKFVESVGIRFPSERRDAIPELSEHYESNVPGVYVIGSLAGYPLIKQAMNQGFDVVEFARGNHIEPADHPLLEYQFAGLPYERPVNELLERFQSLIPMFRELNSLTFRELVIESNVIAAYPEGDEFDDVARRLDKVTANLAGRAKVPRVTRLITEGAALYEIGEFGTSFYTVVDGEVILQRHSEGRTLERKLVRGQFFGEMSLLSGRPRLDRAIAGPGALVVETPRRLMVKLMNSNETVRDGIDWIFVVRELQSQFAPNATADALRDIAGRIAVHSYRAGDVIFSEGEQAGSLHVIRSGGVSLSRSVRGEDVVVAQVRAGNRIGDMALMGDPTRRETARAVVATETIEIGRPEFIELLSAEEERIRQLQLEASQHAKRSARMEVRPESGNLMNFLMQQGLGEATNVLVIDQSLCVGCDNCEKACAETHGGVSRLDRKDGPTFVDVHIPNACRHCEQPHCMKDCPPNAIRRAETGEVYINDSCIGCGNCVTNCPYGVVRMSYQPPTKPNLINWMLFGAGPGPGQPVSYAPTDSAKKAGQKATKCDACIDVPSGPACVTACPTGAAIRIGPERYVDLVEERKR